MATTINIGVGSSTFYANTANTTYVLKTGDRRTSENTYAIDAMTEANGRTFTLNGQIEEVNRGIQVGYGSDDTTINIGKTGLIDVTVKGVVVEGDNATISNAGTVLTESSTTAMGIYAKGDNAQVANSGFISSYYGINVAGAGASINNSGTVFGTYAIHLSADDGETTRFVNSGNVYSSNGIAFSGFKSDDTVVNSGILNGDVQLDDGNDVFRMLGGYVNGAVYGAAGNDTYITNSAALDIRETSLSGGYDTLKSSVSNTMTTYIEEGWLTGRRNASLTGNDAGNVMYGNNANNKMVGDMGMDFITGGRGNDRLTGGDALGTAGDIGDVFVFKAHSGRDVITDFQDGMDHINLQAYKGIDSMADLKGHIKVAGDDLIIQLLDGDSIRIDDMERANLSLSDFQF